MVCSNERGAGLVIAILTVMALFALGMALMFLTRTDVNISKHQTLHVEALYVAEAGVEEALHRLALQDPTMVTVNGASMNAAIRDTVRPYDPDWRARVFLCSPGTEPTASGSDYHTCTIQDNTTWLEYSSQSDPNTALTIEHKWRDLDGDGVRENGEIVMYDGSRYPPENFSTGSPVEVITVNARSATAERQIKVEATKFPLNINARAALLCDMGVDVRGNVTVCGHDHRYNTPHYTMYPNCQNFEYCGPPLHSDCVAQGCLVGVMTTGDPIDRRGSTDLDGEPAAEDTSSTNQFLTLAEMLGVEQDVLDEILANAHFFSTGAADPQDGITYVDNAGGADASWTNGNGTGLLYVTGNFSTSGNFTWRGLIYVEGDYTMAGTPSIVGAVVVRGISTWAFTGGDPCILYSSEALDYYLRQHLHYLKIGWKETGGL
jgi:Tfp pilus assembly protein PilX